ncbi:MULTISPECIES: class I SAM-dependent methyltransferase [unclassified Fusibacter]|uniref:class I SAM-dependent methyltransferase n=1 Tax=unclassified Fusibacter TaxID=2624464 RepID=UPI0013E9818E|nr:MULTISPECIES: class I SAM-dependent methyltransferase [unclassified Fusibacter]MCK8061116.1 class I SAM-dependent methyltransferase [Fusibacter sp. A2]NPE23348.1 class I SAM-dependent methyltransferase [Fusibacter sp. A1]
MDYKQMKETKFVENQYSNAQNLELRKDFHRKYSTNREGLGKWLVRQYKFSPGMKILELGSGKGDLWTEVLDELINKKCQLVLSDLSSGMVDIMSEIYKNKPIEVKAIDIQSIPFEDDTFDVVIANAMLYHVPDLNKALGEVARVLKPSGCFYASTFGQKGISQFIDESLQTLELSSKRCSEINFTLQSGKNSLSNHFSYVDIREYHDGLEVSDTKDLIAYILSMTSMMDSVITSQENINKMTDYFNGLKNEFGILAIAKEYGSFVCKK